MEAIALLDVYGKDFWLLLVHPNTGDKLYGRPLRRRSLYPRRWGRHIVLSPAVPRGFLLAMTSGLQVVTMTLP